MNAFNRNLKTLREAAKLSRAELAKEIGVSPFILRHWETQSFNTPHIHLAQLAEYFNITVDELINEKKMKIISYNITHLRKKKGLTQEKMAWDLDITRSRLSSWEEHRAEPGIEMLIKISDYFSDYSVDELIKKDLRKCI
jgi:transcriptional regulator with XRE-family HTH domain